MEINNNPIFAKLNVRAFELGMDALKKLDKIEQIMNQDQAQWGVVKDTWLYKEIRKVLEDGNDK